MSDAISREELYQQSVEEDVRTGTKTLALLAALLFPLFSFLDYFTQREHFVDLSIIRFSTTFFFLCVYLIFWRGLGLKNPIRTGTIITIIAGLSITLMCMVLDGAESPYYAGVNLVMLAGVLILPANAWQMARVVFFIVAIYILGVMWVEGFDLEEPGAFINNLFFLISTAVIGVVAAHLMYRRRREAFLQSLEVKRSVDLLKSDLKGHESDIEGLAKQMVERKCEAQKALEIRDGFMSMASHELKTPLTALKLQLDIALMKISQSTSDPEKLQNNIKTAHHQIDNITRLVDEMLDVSRIESGKFVIEKQAMELNELMMSVLDRYYAEAISTGKLTFCLSEDKLNGIWDAFKIEQVILNLVNNGFRYGGGSVVSIETKSSEGNALIIVQDKGPGITKEDQLKIFGKFEKGHSTGSQRGLGLGLFITKEIIDAHQGGITLESNPGEGALFTVSLPLSEPR